MFSVRKAGFLLAALAVLGVAVTTPARAAITIYSNRALFIAASSGLTNLDFEGLAAPGSFIAGTPSISVGDAVFSPGPGGGFLFVVDPAFYPPFYDWGSGAVLSGQFGSPSGVSVALGSGGYTAVGSDVMTIEPYAGEITVTLDNGTSHTFSASSLAYPNRAFIGIISDTPIVSLSFTAPATGVHLDNFLYGRGGTTAPVPEFSTVSLFGGLLGMGALTLRRRRVVNVAR